MPIIFCENVHMIQLVQYAFPCSSDCESGSEVRTLYYGLGWGHTLLQFELVTGYFLSPNENENTKMTVRICSGGLKLAKSCKS